MNTDLECEECGRTFLNTAGLFTHQKKSCRPGKRSLKDLLSDARGYWKTVSKEASSSQKRRRLGSPQGSNARPVQRSPAPGSVVPISNTGLDEETSVLNLPVAVVGSQDSINQPTSSTTTARVLDMAPTPISSYSTRKDGFGLFKKFWGSEKPTHNPEHSSQPSISLQNCHSDWDGHVELQLQDPELPEDPERRKPNPPSGSELRFGRLDPNIAPSPGALSYYPYPNWSSFALGDWYWSQGVINSKERFRKLLEILRHRNFKKEDVCSTSWDQIHQILPDGLGPPDHRIPHSDLVSESPQWVDDHGFGWSIAEVNLDVPFPNHGAGPKVKTFGAGVLHYRSIVSIIREKMSNPSEFPSRHIHPYELLWQPNPQTQPIRTYGDMFSLAEFLRVQEKVQGMPLRNEADVGLERVVVALMFWSDATLLANFGTAKLWPCYLFFGNDSKYRRAKPATNLCNHVAYFEALPDRFKDWYRAQSGGQSPAQDLVTYCNREIFHRQWDILLDDELVQAMHCGIRILCPDNTVRLFFPWVFTYSADYPEKTLIGTVRSLGQKPCPRCLVSKCDLHQMGTPEDATARISQPRVDDQARQEKVDAARSVIIDQGYAVANAQVETLLKQDSMLPIRNAFSRLSHLGFDIYSTLVVDLMHEFELGVWKALFVHLIRILEAHDCLTKESSVNELDRRYRRMPTFGVDAVRKFSSNASEQKRLGARDYENLLQCAVPAFDGLLPEPHNSVVCQLIAVCAEWHALAKLRLHTEETVKLLEITTTVLAERFRVFIGTTCNAYTTLEIAKEYAARFKRASKTAKRANPPPSSTSPARLSSTPPPLPTSPSMPSSSVAPPLSTCPSGSGSSATAPPGLEPQLEQAVPTPVRAAPIKGKVRKTMNLDTYKYHALADYHSTIRRFGTTDSYSVERGELEHKFPKSWYLRTDKKTYRLQLARIERRRANLRKIRQRNQADSDPVPVAVAQDMDKAVPPLEESLSYKVAKSQTTFESTSFYHPQYDNGNDPAYVDFLPMLQKHLLPRVRKAVNRRHTDNAHDGTQDTTDWTFVGIRDNRIYEHKTIRICYTSYDARAGEDIIRAGGVKSTVMVLNPSYPTNQSAHPFLYAKVHGIFHANVVYINGLRDPDPVRIDFLWVRWFQWEGRSAGSYGFHLLSLPPITTSSTFGFLDPADVIRGCHIIPRVHEPDDYVKLQESTSGVAQDAEDCFAYFVNPFPDRDMYMRYQWGYAVGHHYTHPFSLRCSLTPVDLPPTAFRHDLGREATLACQNEPASTDETIAEPPLQVQACAIAMDPSLPSAGRPMTELYPDTEALVSEVLDAVGEDDWVFPESDEESISDADREDADEE